MNIVAVIQFSVLGVFVCWSVIRIMENLTHFNLSHNLVPNNIDDLVNTQLKDDQSGDVLANIRKTIMSYIENKTFNYHIASKSKAQIFDRRQISVMATNADRTNLVLRVDEYFCNLVWAHLWTDAEVMHNKYSLFLDNFLDRQYIEQQHKPQEKRTSDKLIQLLQYWFASTATGNTYHYEHIKMWLCPQYDYIYTAAGFRLLLNRYLQPNEPIQMFILRIAKLFSYNPKKGLLNTSLWHIYYNLFGSGHLQISSVLADASNADDSVLPGEACCLMVGTDTYDRSFIRQIERVCSIASLGVGVGINLSNVPNQGVLQNGQIHNGMEAVLKRLDSCSYLHIYERKPNIAVYIHVHCDTIYTLLCTRNPLKKHLSNIFPGLFVSNYFMYCVQHDLSWYLFSGRPCLDGICLHDVSGAAYQQLFQRMVDLKMYSYEKKARDIMNSIVSAIAETGAPYIVFQDQLNKYNNQKHKGPIKTLNLCSEITNYADANDTASCTLMSVNVARYKTFKSVQVMTNNIVEELSVISMPTILLCDNSGGTSSSSSSASSSCANSFSLPSHSSSSCCIDNDDDNDIIAENNNSIQNNDTVVDDDDDDDDDDIFYDTVNNTTTTTPTKSSITNNSPINNADTKTYADGAVQYPEYFQYVYNLGFMATYALNNLMGPKRQRREIGISPMGVFDLAVMLNENPTTIAAQVCEILYMGAVVASISYAHNHHVVCCNYPGSGYQKAQLQFDLRGVQPLYPKLWAKIRPYMYHGMANSMLTTQAPTATTAHLTGVCESVTLPMNFFTIHESENGRCPLIPYGCMISVAKYFNNTITLQNDINQQVAMYAKSAPYVDHSQATQFFLEWTNQNIFNLITKTYMSKLKTGIYYALARRHNKTIPLAPENSFTTQRLKVLDEEHMQTSHSNTCMSCAE